MNVTDYFKIASSFSKILQNNDEKELANQIDKILENEDEESPRIWIPQIHTILQQYYKNKINCPFYKELLEILVKGENSKRYW
jgi:hypothetical protein